VSGFLFSIDSVLPFTIIAVVAALLAATTLWWWRHVNGHVSQSA
jgi:hypothetical protein